MIVCIAEKPSVAADIAKIIGATHHHRVGRNAGYYEGNGYQVTWTFGHLCELKNPEEYSPYWKAWSLAALPMVPERFGIRLKEGVEEQFHVIEQLFAKAERIINCGDAGQEGELIQRWVMQKAGATCPVERLWISSMTEEAIREGFARLRPQSDYQGLYEAGLCRAIGDWLLGMNATRLYTLKYGDNNRRRGAQPLSIGRVQTPTLAMIVERQHEIQNFQPEPYWVLSTIYRDVTFTARLEADDEDDKPQNNDETEGKSPANKSLAKRGFTNREEAEAALKAIEGTPFSVQKVTQKKGTEAPPRLFDLTSLQVECNKKYGYGADLTLQLIQQLYENKFTTYPRVDTTYLPDDMYDRCPAILKGIRDYHVGRTQPLTQWLEPLRHAPLRKSKKVFDNAKITDHHAIIPTGVLPQGLTDVQRNVYDLIVQRFVAVFYPDCRFATTTVDGEAAGIPFRASGKVIVEEGWRVLFPKANAAREGGANAASSSSAAGEGGASAQAGNAGSQRSDDERTLPPFQKGETGPHTPTLTQKETTPPKPFTEATLLRAMETAGRNVDDEELREAMKENGIGRPSTRAAIIQTLYKRGYIRLQRKSLEATPTGVALIGLIQEELLKSAELTGIWENKLRQIEHHTYSAQQFMAELKQMVSELVHTVLCDNTNRRVEQAPAPSGNTTSGNASAGKSSSEKTSSAGKSSAKQGTSSPENSSSSPENSNGEAKPKRKIIRAGSKCPQCGEGKVIKGHTAYGCSRWKEGCNWRKPF